LRGIALFALLTRMLASTGEKYISHHALLGAQELAETPTGVSTGRQADRVAVIVGKATAVKEAVVVEELVAVVELEEVELPAEAVMEMVARVRHEHRFFLCTVTRMAAR